MPGPQPQQSRRQLGRVTPHPSTLGFMRNPGVYHYITVYIYPCIPRSPYSCITVSLYPSMPVSFHPSYPFISIFMYHCIRIPLYLCFLVVLYTFTTISVIHSITISMHHCIIVSLSNLPGNSCYVSAVIQGLTAIEMDLHLDGAAARGPEQAALDAALVQLCGDRRDPSHLAINPTPLVTALNPCLALAHQPVFSVQQPSCAGDFLAALLGQLAIEPGFLVNTMEDSLCQDCGENWTQVKPDYIF